MAGTHPYLIAQRVLPLTDDGRGIQVIVMFSLINHEVVAIGRSKEEANTNFQAQLAKFYPDPENKPDVQKPILQLVPKDDAQDSVS